MKLVRTMTKAQQAARIRNWNKRVLTGHTKALKTTLDNNGLSNKEKEKIQEVCDICTNLLSEWPKRIKE